MPSPSAAPILLLLAALSVAQGALATTGLAFGAGTPDTLALAAHRPDAAEAAVTFVADAVRGRAAAREERRPRLLGARMGALKSAGSRGARMGDSTRGWSERAAVVSRAVPR